MPGSSLLIADDEESIRQLFTTLVSALLNRLAPGMDYELTVAADGVEAVAAFERHRPELILMDINMPFMDGVEAFDRITELNGGRPVKTVFITGFASSGSVQRRLREAVANGALGYYSKPIGIAELESILRSYFVPT
jgi:CheY-like chemotaxis protein